ncbi:DUF6132 family protein [Proteiniphilum sp. UBA1028]|jgi:hypothetical protein|uniref:DUF6132 family protein n=1 Tax=Proteiniphilum sp. UBA1028 TaxID=1947251 RepID=UPI0025D136D5|nr:DUF6132 family protein [Proteiniphilum sp. UBA1028]
MKTFLIKHWLKIAGVTVGSLGGYLYYYYVGCLSGTCPITSNPYRMIIYGALIGYLFFDMFSPKKNPKKVIEKTHNGEKGNES